MSEDVSKRSLPVLFSLSHNKLFRYVPKVRWTFVFHSESVSESESDDETEEDDNKSTEINDSELSNQGV